MSDSDRTSALAMVTRDQIAEWSEKSDRPGLRRLSGHLSLLCVTGAAVSVTTGIAQAFALTAHGIALIFLFAPAHEAIHRTAFKTRWLNDAMARAIGFLLILPAEQFRYFHFAHHRHTQDPERDPELASPKPTSWPGYLWALTGWGYWSGQISAVVGMAMGRPLPDYVPTSAGPMLRREARLHLLGYGAIAALSVAMGSSLALMLWVVPAVLGQPFLRAYLMAEHTGCALDPDMLANSRTTFTSRMIRWLAWEMPNHSAHHAFPQVPFHRLSAVTAALRPHLRATARGYGDAHRQIITTLSA